MTSVQVDWSLSMRNSFSGAGGYDGWSIPPLSCNKVKQPTMENRDKINDPAARMGHPKTGIGSLANGFSGIAR
jgi:hypothetical protein